MLTIPEIHNVVHFSAVKSANIRTYGADAHETEIIACEADPSKFAKSLFLGSVSDLISFTLVHYLEKTHALQGPGLEG